MDVGNPHIQNTYDSCRGLQKRQDHDKRRYDKALPHDQSRGSDPGTKTAYHLFLQGAPDQYEILEMNRISGFVDRARGLGRPTKKDRRELEQFTDPGMMDDGFDFEFDFEDPDDDE